MHDYYAGLDMDSFTVKADFPIGETQPGENLAPRFRPVGEGVYEWKLSKPITTLPKGILTVSVMDLQGNVTRIERTFRVRRG